jgi:hypothetical protein
MVSGRTLVVAHLWTATRHCPYLTIYQRPFLTQLVTFKL